MRCITGWTYVCGGIYLYLLKLSFRTWRIAPFSQAFSALAVGFLLFLIGFLIWLEQGIRPILSRLQREQVITAYLSPSVETRDEAKLLNEVKGIVEAEGHPEVKLVDVPEFISLMKTHHESLGRELEHLGTEMNQIIPRYISISGILKSSVFGKIKSLSGIEEVESSKDRHRQIVGVFSVLRWIVRILSVGVFFALMIGLIHLSRMNQYFYRDALIVLKLWGAGQGTLMTPSLISAFSVGLIGGVIAAMAWILGGAWLAVHMQSLSGVLRTMPSIRASLAMVFLIAGGGVGLLAGMLGGFPFSRFSEEGGGDG